MIALVDALALLGRKRALAWLALHEGVALTVCLVPGVRLVLGTPGFEFAFVAALLTALSSGHLGTMAAARVREAGPSASAAACVGRAFVAGFVAELVLLSLSFATVLVAGVWNGLCDYATGAVFFGLLPVIGAVLGVSLGVLLGLLTHKRFLPYVLYLLVSLGSLAFSIFWLMTQSPIFAYDPFFGHFPGAVYDELIVVRAPLLWFRLETLLWAAGGLVLAMAFVHPSQGRLAWRQLRLPTLCAALLLVTGAALMRANGHHLGYFSSSDDVAAALGGRRETEHFIIHYPRRGPVAERIDAVALDHEFRYAQLRAYFGVEPAGKVHSFLFASPESKAALMGARHVSIAKPWILEMHLHDMGHPHPVLRHELAHVFGGAMGGLFGVSAKNAVSYNVGLIEGLAVAADWNLGPLTGHEWSKAAFEFLGPRAPRIEDLIGVTGFWSQSGALAYTLCGSFVRHLVERYGVARMREAYAMGDFAGAFGKPVETLTAEWRQMLDALPLEGVARRAAEERFRRPGLFHRACGHEVARLQSAAAAARDDDDPRAEILAREEVLALERGSAHRALELADALWRGGEDKRGRALLEEAVATRAGRADQQGAIARLEELRADIDWRADRHREARETYGRLLGSARLPDDARRLTVKRAALDHDVAGPMVRELFSGRLRGREKLLAHLQTLTEQAPDFLIGHYLLGRHLYAGEQWAQAGRALVPVVTGSLPGLELGVEAKRLFAYASLWLRDWSGAERVFGDVAKSRLSEATRLEALDGLERVRFSRAYESPSQPAKHTGR